MFDIMESIQNLPLESSSNIFKAKGKLMISESPPRENERGFMLVRWKDIYLIIDQKVIHNGKDNTSNTIINNLVNKMGRVVVLRTSMVKILIIKENTNCALFFPHFNDIRNPFSKRNMVNKMIT